MKRAVLIVTDPDVSRVFYQEMGEGWTSYPAVMPSEQLLADLRTLANPSQYNSVRRSDAAARVRALLPEGDE